MEFYHLASRSITTTLAQLSQLLDSNPAPCAILVTIIASILSPSSLLLKLLSSLLPLPSTILNLLAYFLALGAPLCILITCSAYLAYTSTLRILSAIMNEHRHLPPGYDPDDPEDVDAELASLIKILVRLRPLTLSGALQLAGYSFRKKDGREYLYTKLQDERLYLYSKLQNNRAYLSTKLYNQLLDPGMGDDELGWGG